MELEEKYEKLLLEIHESDKERFKSQFVEHLSKDGRNNIKEELNQLIEYELVEFDRTDDSYYLTYEGYEEVEGILESRITGKQITELEYQYQIKRSRNKKLKNIVGGLLIAVLAFLTLYGIRLNTKPELTPELLYEIKEKITITMDSINSDQIRTQINKSWNWTGLVADKILDTNEFGNIIYSSEKGEIYRICPEKLSIEIIASSIIEYQKLKTDQKFLLDWKMKELVEIAKRELGELKDFERFCLKTPAVISQDYSSKNLDKIQFIELIAVSGDLANQNKDLKGGQELKLNIID